MRYKNGNEEQNWSWRRKWFESAATTRGHCGSFTGINGPEGVETPATTATTGRLPSRAFEGTLTTSWYRPEAIFRQLSIRSNRQAVEL